MATVYTVSIGDKHVVPDGIHGGMDIFNEWFLLTLIDGESEWDRWIMDANRGYYAWPDKGEWLHVSSGTSLTLFTADSGSRLATFALSEWPMKRGSGGDVQLWRPINGKDKALYYVNMVE